ncbi:MAG: hypothetical protein U0835_12930 [Isosphaeraceae bacterium]
MVTLLAVTLLGADPVMFFSTDFTPAVCKELKLDVKTIAAINQVVRDKNEQVVKLLREESPENPSEPKDQIRFELEAEARIARLLTKPQRRRATELFVQKMGVISVVYPPIAEWLNVSEETVAEINRTVHSARARSAQALTERLKSNPNLKLTQLKPEQTAGQREVSAAYREAERLLTRKQRERLKALAGEPFRPDGSK